jgi:ATP-dependent helicase YprA (DUF1998 family)
MAIEQPISPLLESARHKATELRNYDSEQMRKTLEDRFRQACNGKTPYDWQKDVTEAIFLGIPCLVIAGTGAGKTLPLVTPLLMDDTKKKMALVISPLNELEEEQVSLELHFDPACLSDVHRPKNSRIWA